MKILSSFLVASFCWTLSLTQVGGAIPPKTAEDMAEEADGIIVGSIQEVTTSRKSRLVGGGKETTITYVSTILIEKVEKGGKLKAGEEISVHTWKSSWAGVGPVPPGHNGHFHTPVKGEKVQVYFEEVRGGKNFVILQGGMKLAKS